MLVLGANGQVGRELRRALQGMGGTLILATREGTLAAGGTCETVDLSQPDMLNDLLECTQPHIIINAAAYTAVDRAEDEPELAQRINGDAPGVMGLWAARRDALVVHYSTDYVFDGHDPRPRREDDPVAPLGVYGHSKRAGEVALQDSGAAHLIFRTAWVYAAHGHNFLKTMLRLGAEREQLNVVDDQHGTPTSAALIADVTATALKRWSHWDRQRKQDACGIHHLVADGETTWCGFARAIMQRAVQAGLLQHAPDVAAIGSDAFPTRARRPAFSTLDTRRLRDTFDITLPRWQSGLDAVITDLAQKTQDRSP